MRATWPGVKLRVSPDFTSAFSTVVPSGAAISTQLSPLNWRVSAPAGAGAAVVNAIYNATGIRVRDVPVTLDTLLAGLPPV